MSSLTAHLRLFAGSQEGKRAHVAFTLDEKPPGIAGGLKKHSIIGFVREKPESINKSAAFLNTLQNTEYQLLPSHSAK